MSNKRLRFNEYYGMQPIFDNLYKQSMEGSNFRNLYDIITSDNNIMLAYRTIKRNNGSKTPGTNRHNIKYWENQPAEKYIAYIQGRLENYYPQKVRRVEIPKPNGKTRPLGIPCIEDRIIQQCIKQVLEPICEAKFYPHSYGFRPNRSTEHAIAYMVKKVNLDKLHYVVDIDIKGFFDNVDHSKLMKQLWAIGIRDKKVLCIIGKMLKAEIDKEGIPMKGVPQGGILSPLLANIVLNELDWWISGQWETFETQQKYANVGNMHRALKKNSKLKEMYMVRYADDFKILCRKKEDADKAFIAVSQWLKERLHLEISPDKSKITNLRKEASEFLGFQIKGQRKRNKIIAYTSVTEKAKKSAEVTIKEQIKNIQHKKEIGREIYLYNRIVAGLQNYYKIANNVSKDFADINYHISKSLQGRLRLRRSRTGNKSKEYLKRYEHYGGKDIFIWHEALYPVWAIKSSIPRLFRPAVCNYTKSGRELIHTQLGFVNWEMLDYLSKNPIPDESVEYNDNRLSLYSAQWGKCKITKLPLNEDMVVHRIVPKDKGGDDRYSNLILLHPITFELIVNNNLRQVKKYLWLVGNSKKLLKQVNYYRKKYGNEIIME